MRHAIFLGFIAIVLSGCAGHSEFMTKAAGGTPPVAPVPDAATIVFIRDSGFAFAINFAIMDQFGDLMGEAVAKSHFAVQVPPGRYFFFAKAENIDVVEANVAAGRLYHVHVIPKIGAWQAHVRLDPIKPNEREWAELPEWIAGSTHLIPIGAQGHESAPTQRTSS